MSTQILATKLYKPVLRSNSVLRPRLIERLNMGLHGKLTLATAPAGFGKTTVIAEWISSEDFRVAWLSLDEGDNDPVRFLTCIVAALQTIETEIGVDILNLLESPQPPPIESLLTPLVNEIATIPHEFMLVLDDYHVLDSTEINSVLAFLIDNQPPQMHLVITTREDPRLPLARLRARGRLTELRATDLRFTPDEAAEFLNNVMGLSLAPEDVAALERRTEGWIAGLQLAAISMQGQQDNRQFIESFTGSHHFVVDYLMEEVLAHQPPHIQDFLLKTSILERMCGPLCAAVLQDDEDAQATLERIRQANLFLIPLDNERHWYRYHHLFGDLLRKRLQQSTTTEVSTLHIRASIWFEEAGFYPEAIASSLAAQDFNRAADQIERTWPIIPKGIRPAVWRGWVQKLPEAQIQVRPILSAAHAWILVNDGELDAAAATLNIVDRWLADIEHNSDRLSEMIVANRAQLSSLPGITMGARAYLTQAAGNHLDAIHYAQTALELLPEDEHYWRGGIALFLGLAQWRNGDLAHAYESINLSIVSLRKTNDRVFHRAGAAHLGRISLMMGHLNRAHDQYKEALDLADAGNKHAGHLSINFFVGLADLYYEWDDLETANHYVQRGMTLREHTILSNSAYRLDVAMARMCTAQHDFNAALDWLSRAEKAYQQTAEPDVYPIASLRARIWIRQGRISDVNRWLNEQGLLADDDLDFSLEFDHITVVRLRLVQFSRDQEDEVLQGVLDLIDRLLQAAAEGGRKTQVIELCVLQSLAHYASNDTQTAVNFLQRALEIADPEGFVRIFTDEGQPMHDLLSQAAARGIMPDYTRRLLTAFERGSTPIASTAAQPLIEPLSERELEILALVADGLSNREISERLFISISTVKGHNRNIFDKLQVKRRTEAVAYARELGLI